MLLEIMFYLAFEQQMQFDPLWFLPPATDAIRFPASSKCLDQISKLRNHLDWLEMMEKAWPERREDFKTWKDETRHHIFLWEVVQKIDESKECPDDLRWNLERYKFWIGKEKYREEWLPLSIPKASRSGYLYQSRNNRD